MLNDGVPPAPGSRKLFGASAQSQRLLINFEPGMGDHSVAALQLEEVSDKVSDKGWPKGSAKCPNSSAGQNARLNGRQDACRYAKAGFNERAPILDPPLSSPELRALNSEP